MDDCVFCKIVAGEVPVTMVEEWTSAIAFVPLNPVTPGHVLIVPREHVADATKAPDVTASVMWYAAQYATAPCNIITSAGTEATQSIFHLHVHVVPRKENDGLCLPWACEY